jgi:glyoxylate/hydroxypyruvate reductase A
MDDGLVGQMSEYALYWGLWHHRDIEKYAASQRTKKWKPEQFIDSIHRRIGVMGLGTIGQDTAKKFAALGFPNRGLSRTQKTLPGVETFHGPSGLPKFLGQTNILVNVLPLTRETRGIMDKTVFAALPKGCFRDQHGTRRSRGRRRPAGRPRLGSHQRRRLDVFNVEPLPPEHPYWAHPRVHITPHMAGYTNPRTASPGVIDNIKDLARGQPLRNTVDAKTGY